MAKIYKLFSNAESPPKTHSVDSANDLLPLIRKYTETAIRETQSSLLKLSLHKKGSPQYKQASRAYELAIGRWVQRIHRVGGLAKGLWLVDFDTGQGFLCWVYPEKRVEYFHSYTGGFQSRKKIKLPQDLPSRTQA